MSYEINCKICNKVCNSKGFPLHVKTHGYIFKEYVKLYLDDFKPLWKLCPICKDNVTDKKTCSKACGIVDRKEYTKGRNIWNSMSEETKETAKKLISEKASKRQVGRNIWSEMSEPTKENAKKEIAKKTSKRCAGTGNPMYGKMWTESTIKKILGSRKMNKLERKLGDFLKQEGVLYKKQFYQKWNGRRYFYDFIITGTNILIETDGDYWHGGPGVKKHHRTVEDNKIVDSHKNEIAKERGFTLLRFWESEIKADFESVKSKILHEIQIRKIHEID